MKLGEIYLGELEAEEASSRKCVERFKEDLYDYKPHEKSMAMGYLVLLTAEMPLWIKAIIEDGVIDLATWKKFTERSPEALLAHFDECIQAAKKALQSVTDEELEEPFYLKMNEQELMKDTKRNTISSSLNHWVHHRGQLTVYMRLNNLPVPSIYGPSADDKGF